MTTGNTIDLPTDTVHIWRAALDVNVDVLRGLTELLDDDERARSQRFRFDVHRDQYLVGRGVLRSVLARYVHVPPAQVGFTYGPNGKPGLSGPLTDSGIEFNLSHSGGQALIAVARQRRVGIDIEYHRPDRDLLRLARRFFHTDEADDVAAAHGSELADRFFFYWTCKEAYLKGIGGGITVGLDRFAVRRPRTHTDAPLRLTCDELEPQRWALCSLDADEGYSAAIAYEQPGASVRWYEWSL